MDKNCKLSVKLCIFMIFVKSVDPKFSELIKINVNKNITQVKQELN